MSLVRTAIVNVSSKHQPRETTTHSVVTCMYACHNPSQDMSTVWSSCRMWPILYGFIVGKCAIEYAFIPIVLSNGASRISNSRVCVPSLFALSSWVSPFVILGELSVVACKASIYSYIITLPVDKLLWGWGRLVFWGPVCPTTSFCDCRRVSHPSHPWQLCRQWRPFLPLLQHSSNSSIHGCKANQHEKEANSFHRLAALLSVDR